MTPVSAVKTIDEALVLCRDMDASVNERLACYAEAVRRFSPPFAEAVDRLVTRLKNAGAGEAAPRSGDPMPPFVLPDEDGRLVSLVELLKNGPVAVTFHRGHWCPYCRNETSPRRGRFSEAPRGLRGAHL